jgi:hypothetical protein
MAQIKNIITNELLGKEGQSYREHFGGDGVINTASSYSYVGRVLFVTVLWPVAQWCW